MVDQIFLSPPIKGIVIISKNLVVKRRQIYDLSYLRNIRKISESYRIIG